MRTIGGIDTGLLAKQPTPDELAKIVARWNSEDQALFLVTLGEELRNCCGGRHFMQWQYIAESVASLEGRLLDGSGSQLITEIASRLSAAADTLADLTPEAQTLTVRQQIEPHIHVAGTTVGEHIDTCATCGRDIRDPIHNGAMS